MREHRHLRASHIHLDRCSHPIDFHWVSLGHPPRFLDQANKLPGTSIGDRRLVGIQFDDRVVDACARQSRQHMLHRMHLDRPFSEGGGALGVDDMLGPSLDLRGAIEVDPPEAQARVGQGRQEVHRNSVSAMETDSGE